MSPRATASRRSRLNIMRRSELRARAPGHLLQLERVAVGIGEVRSLDPAAEVVDLVDVDTAADELGPRLLDVRDHEVQAPDAARLCAVHIEAGPEADRAAGALGGHL